MPLLAEYVLTPDIFDSSCYSTQEVCGFHLQMLKDVLLAEGLVRDLREGEWSRLVMEGPRPWHRRSKEVVKKLTTQGRLIRFAPALTAVPAEDREWCLEALETHKKAAISGGIIVTESVKAGFASEPLVARVDRLGGIPWWAARASSVRLARTMADYQDHLGPVLRHANSIMFIDPHVDPSKYGYREFAQLLARSGGRTPVPTIEIHRVCYERSGVDRTIDLPALERRFRQELTAPLSATALRVEVFVWDDFHDRYVISNLVGISVPNGFDTSGAQSSLTTWTRLGRDDRDDIQREFDRASGRHALRARFAIP